MLHSDINTVNVLVLETTEVVENENSDIEMCVCICVRNCILVMGAIYYLVALTLCWLKN
jgi:hypothetical protein